MSVTTESLLNLNVYEEDLNEDTTVNLSSSELEVVPSFNQNIIVSNIYRLLAENYSIGVISLREHTAMCHSHSCLFVKYW